MGVISLPENDSSASKVQGGRQGFTTTSKLIEPTEWVRTSDWLEFPSISPEESKFVGLYAVFEDDTNFIALSAAGNYTVDWGDGTIENFASGTSAYHKYTYSSIPSNTYSSRGYRQVLVTVTPQAGETFSLLDLRIKHNQVSLNSYDTSWLDIAVAGPSLTTLTWGRINDNVALRMVERARIISSALTSYSYQFGNLLRMQSVSVASSAAVTDTSFMFFNCPSLQTVPLFDTSAVTNMSGMLQACSSLVTVPLFDTSLVTNMSNMFTTSYRLQSVPRFNTASVTNMSSMFSSCSVLTEVPLFDTSSVTNMSSMFNSCYSLQTIPKFNTPQLTNISQMFRTCYALQRIPAFDTSKVTDMSFMFYQCYSLQEAPAFDTSSATNMSSMFNICVSLKDVPLYNTSKVTNMSSMFSNCIVMRYCPDFDTSSVTLMNNMFYNCYNLQAAPNFNTSNVINMGSMFYQCYSLKTVPQYNTSKVSNMEQIFYSASSMKNIPLLDASGLSTAIYSNPLGNAFYQCYTLARGALSRPKFTVSYASCNLSKDEMEYIFDNLGFNYGTSFPTITVNGNWGVPTPVSLSGTTTSGSSTVTMASTTGLETGMEISGTGISDAVSVTFQQDPNTITRNAHGLNNGTKVGFATLVGVGGVSQFTPYYVVNSTANTFQVSDTLGGSAKDIEGTAKFASITSGSSSTDASTYTTSSVTLTAGRLYLFAIENSYVGSASAVSGITGGAGVPTFTSRGTTLYGTTDLYRVSVWSAVPTSNYTGTLTINFGGTTQTGACWSITEVQGVDTTTDDGIVQSVSATGNSGTASVNLASLSNANNSVFGIQAHNSTASSAPIATTTYVELHDLTTSTPAQALQTLYSSPGTTNVTSTISSTAWGIIAIELKDNTTYDAGTGTMIYPTTITAINPNVSVSLSVPASASGTVTTSSAILKRSMARLRGWAVSG